MEVSQFTDHFQKLTGFAPLRWQVRLFEWMCRGDLPESVDIPTGLGKTSVMALWLLARAAGAALPCRLVYVVDRRVVVDQATRYAEKLRQGVGDEAKFAEWLGLGERKLPISTLRGNFADNREWLSDPSIPAIIIGTVDMIGSRLLFQGYGVSRTMRPYHAGLLGADTLLALDEAHLSAPFLAMIRSVANEKSVFWEAEMPRPVQLLPLSATGSGNSDDSFTLTEEEQEEPWVKQRLEAVKRLHIEDIRIEGTKKKVYEQKAKEFAERAWKLADSANGKSRVVIYLDSRELAQMTCDEIRKRIKEHKLEKVLLLTGARRGMERDKVAKDLEQHHFLADSDKPPDTHVFLVATAAGEVGIDLNADHMVCDLVPWERMVQRFGRVNRRGDGDAKILVLDFGKEEREQARKQVEEAHKKAEEAHKKAEEAHKKAEEASEKAEQARKQAEKSKSKKDRKKAKELANSYRKKAKELANSYRKKVKDLAEFCRLDATRGLFTELPRFEDSAFKAGPGALADLKVRFSDRVAAATTPDPLHPALTRPLVDSWAMTSLRDHTGRPEVAHWLRGWVEDPPQTQIVWRSILPVLNRVDGPVATPRMIEQFFSAAPPHVSEKLETETYIVIDWLKKQVDPSHTKPKDKEIIADEKPATNDEPTRFQPKDKEIVALILDHALSLQGKLTFGELRRLEPKKLHGRMLGRMLIVDARIGGLSKDGLLDAKESEAPITADGEREKFESEANAGAKPEGPVIGFEVIRRRDDEAEKEPAPGWHVAESFAAATDASGKTTEMIDVFVWRGAGENENARSFVRTPVTLENHTDRVERHAYNIACRLALPDEEIKAVVCAAKLHDRGKSAKIWQDAMNAPKDGRPWAKTKGGNGRLLQGYRHEFGSLLEAEEAGRESLPEGTRDLVLHLIASHHGYARPLLAAAGCDKGPPSILARQAGEAARRFARLQRRYGPWGLAWREAILRAADQRASAEEQEQDDAQQKQGKDG